MGEDFAVFGGSVDLGVGEGGGEVCSRIRSGLSVERFFPPTSFGFNLAII